MTDGSGPRPAWVTVRPGGLMHGGRLGPATMHAHHAVQLLVTSGEAGNEDGNIVLRDGHGSERSCRAAVIPAHVPHAVVRGATDCLLVLLDPDTAAARALEPGDGSVGSWVRDWEAEPGRWSSPAEADGLVAEVTGHREEPRPRHPGLERALELIGTGLSLTDAAHASGFADAAHMTRVFRRMFGVAPSDVVRDVRYLD